ncbi:MAG: tetratricopeptide repeat protein [Verrucomicrobia bacterium]|nr:tetratricopeptide repeat protein [Verrucomicrobiota bacterium]
MERKKEKKPIRPESVLRRMERMMGGAGKGKDREAQDLVYDAWEAADGDEAYDLLVRAVELDPTNVDAWLGLMDFEPVEDDERIEMLRQLVDIGEKNLGKRVFKEDKGHFWGLLETRPYMRARSQLALRLMELGRFKESIAEHEGMLELNPNDNQGVRYGLMSCYLAVKRLDGARRLFEQYDERKYSAIWAWAYVLARFLSGNLKAAEKALQDARKQNPHAQAYFLGHRKPPKSMPGSYSIGSREEAILAWDILQHAWKKHPDAQAWLGAQKSGTKE